MPSLTVLGGCRGTDARQVAAIAAAVAEATPRVGRAHVTCRVIRIERLLLREWREGDREPWAALNADPVVMGHLPATEIGWRLARHAWGHGYATEAATAVLDHAYTVLELPEVVSFTAVGSVRSMRVMERIGMVRDPDGDFEHPKVAEGSPLRPHVLYRSRRP